MNNPILTKTALRNIFTKHLYKTLRQTAENLTFLLPKMVRATYLELVLSLFCRGLRNILLIYLSPGYFNISKSDVNFALQN